MDVSKEYIKMCEGAGEIQKKWWTGSLWGNRGEGLLPSGEDGDYFFDHSYGITIRGTGSGTYCREPKPIFLPKQDQLQNVLTDCRKKEGYNIYALVHNIWYWAEDKRNPDNYPVVDFKSMEQLWLAYTMWELYKKSWNGEEWVNE